MEAVFNQLESYDVEWTKLENGFDENSTGLLMFKRCTLLLDCILNIKSVSNSCLHIDLIIGFWVVKNKRFWGVLVKQKGGNEYLINSVVVSTIRRAVNIYIPTNTFHN